MATYHIVVEETGRVWRAWFTDRLRAVSEGNGPGEALKNLIARSADRPLDISTFAVEDAAQSTRVELVVSELPAIPHERLKRAFARHGGEGDGVAAS